MAYVQRIPVRFDHVDFARIVFFPRFFSFCHQTFEDFFGAEVGTPYAVMVGDRKVGYPAVHAEADFKAPLRFGDVCRVELETLKLGTSSITSRYRLFLGDSAQLCAEAKIVTVAMAMDDFSTTPLPDDVRAAFARHAAA
jgi:4-hydroxybenzoyl-CoA thioesterase